MKKANYFGLAQVVLSGVLITLFLMPAYSADSEIISAKDDYITCWKQPCVRVAGSEWSEKNPNGVGVSVRMGTKSIATDDQIKQVLENDFAHHGITNIKFFYERNDVPATGVAFHIRGGTEGPYFLVEAKKEVSKIAKRAANTNELFKPS